MTRGRMKGIRESRKAAGANCLTTDPACRVNSFGLNAERSNCVGSNFCASEK
jgi:hypothetical protein